MSVLLVGYLLAVPLVAILCAWWLVSPLDNEERLVAGAAGLAWPIVVPVVAGVLGVWLIGRGAERIARRLER